MKDISSHLFIPQQEKHGLIGNGKRHNQYYKTPWKGGKEIFLTGCIHSDNKRERKQDDRACFSMANTLICNSIHITLQLDALYAVTWRKTHGNLTQITKLGNANWLACCFFFRNNLIIIALKRGGGGSAFGRKRGWFCGQSWLRMRHENTSGSVGYSSRKGQHASVIGAGSRSFPCSCTPWDSLPTSS